MDKEMRNMMDARNANVREMRKQREIQAEEIDEHLGRRGRFQGSKGEDESKQDEEMRART